MTRRGFTVVAASMVFVLTACADGPFLTWEPETEAEQAVRESTERLQRAVGEGTVYGTLGGSILGALTGGLQGALSGAEVGRFAGAGAGSYVSSLQEKYASKEQVLDQVVKDIAASNAEIEASIANMQRLLVERRGVLRAARADANVSAARAEARGNRNLGEMQKAVDAAEGQAAFFGAARTALSESDPAAARAIDPQLALMRDRIKAMKDIAGSLAREL